jgi:hypothetical protein
MKEVAVLALLVVYNLTLIAGTAYLVQVYDWSMWTFVLTVGFFKFNARTGSR